MLKDVILKDVVYRGVNDEYKSAALITEDKDGNRVEVPVWYDRKFQGVGLRVGDELSLINTASGGWSLKNILKQAEGVEPIEFPAGLFPNAARCGV